LTSSGVAAAPPHESRHQLGGTPGPARTRGPVAAAPAAAIAGLLRAAENPYICSGKSLVSGLCAVPLPPAQDALTWRRGRPVGASSPHPFLA
jgi:hypothetical protein